VVKTRGTEECFSFVPLPSLAKPPAAGVAHQNGAMSEHGKCPMGKHPWLATFFVLAFVLVFLAHKLGLL
jgi:hypothetical protein